MLRERLTITLEPDLIAAADALVDKSSIRNRSHALEHLIKEGLGLHLLRQAFIFADDTWEQPQAEALVKLCQNQGIDTIFLCAKSESARADLRTLAPEITIQDVPLDFGTGGAVLLQQTNLQHPFLLAWLNPALTLPKSLIGAYAAHRRQNQTVTQLITGNGETFASAGIYIANPSLLPLIPAGQASLEQTVFPELLKNGNMATYAITV